MAEAQQLTMNSSEGFRRNENGWQNSVIIIPALLSGSTLAIVAIILWKLLRGKRDKRKGSEDKTGNLYLDGEWAVNAAGVYENSLDTPDPVLEKRRLPGGWTVEQQAFVCNGHFGSISWAVLCRSGETEVRQQVVVKDLSEHCSPGEVQDFLDLMKFYVEVCNHESLVKMLWCQRKPPRLFMKAMSYGNLLTFLRNSRCYGDQAREIEDRLGSAERRSVGIQPAGGAASRITERDVYSMASQVADGLEHLSLTHNLIHGYVASCNVVLHEDMTVQLCGLGLAAIQYRTGSIPARRAARVPKKWQSPERLTGAGISEKSDVWSFGILLYEMVTLGSPPFPDLEPSQMPSKLKKNYRMERPALCGPPLYAVMTNCWQWEAPLRPCFTDVMKQLQNASARADGQTPLTAADALTWKEYLHLAGIPS